MLNWKMKIPELDFIHEVKDVTLREDRDHVSFNSPSGARNSFIGGTDYTLELKLNVINPSNIPSFPNCTEPLTVLLKQVHGGTMKMRMDKCRIYQWNIDSLAMSYGVEYLLIFKGREMEVIQ